ncbi:SdpA family antimicrobial peptide system protein [Corynebacterium resistens]|uniref:SdpA family antimicrobial peptide system protein n=1 Tax=Corynebacterium resistens TaxID=258224 RepID=UPI0009FE8C1B
MTGKSESAVLRFRFYLSFYITSILIALLILTGIFFTMPSNVLSIRDGGTYRTFFSSSLPQAWGFFVKPQLDGEYRAYIVDDSGQTSRADSFPNSSPSNHFGISRSQRSQGPEMAQIAEQNEWKECKSPVISECLVEAKNRQTSMVAENTSKDKTICGNLILLHTKPTIWSYRDFSNERRTSESYQYVAVKC